MSEFSLRGLIRQIRDELGTGDTHRIAKEAAKRISPADQDSAYMQGLTEMARAVVNSGHPHMRPFRAPAPAATPQGAPAKAGNKNSARSSKVAAIRRTWPQLRATYACVDRNLQLGDYGSDQLAQLAAHLEAQATQNAAKASACRDLAAQLSARKVKRVRDLPDDVLAAVFAGAAA